MRPKLPSAVIDANVDVRLAGPLARLACVPGAHVSGGADRVVTVERRHQALGVLLSHRLPHMLHHARHVERDDQPSAQLVLVKQRRRDGDAIGADELLDDSHQLCQQDLSTALPGVLHLVEHVPRGLEDDALGTKLTCEPFQLDPIDFGDVGLAFQDRGEFRNLSGLGRVQRKRLCLVPVQHQRGLEDAVNAHDVWPADLEFGLGRLRLDRGLRRRGRRRSVLTALVRQERERHTEDVDVLGIEQPRCRIQLVGSAPQAPPYDLLAQKLRREGAQAHDMCDRLGVPSLGEHADKDDILDLLAGLPGLAHRVHLLAQLFRLVGLGQHAFHPPVVFLFLAIRVLDGRLNMPGGLFLRLRLVEHFRVNVQDALRVAQLINVDAPRIEGMFHPRRCLGAVAHGDHHRGRRLRLFPLLPCFPPVVAEQVIGVQYQVGKRLLGVGAAVEVVLDLGVVTNVVET